MIRSLTLKLTLAFLFVGLIGALLVAFFAAQRTQRAFDQFVQDRGRTSLITTLAEYFQTNGSWDGVSKVVQHDGINDAGTMGRAEAIVVCAADGEVVLGGKNYPTGSWVPTSDRVRGIPIQVRGNTVGWLLGGPGPMRPGQGSPEADFLSRIRWAISYSAVGAIAVALLLGFLLARTLTHPLHELTVATQAITSEALGQQVKVRSRESLGVLPVSFN